MTIPIDNPTIVLVHREPGTLLHPGHPDTRTAREKWRALFRSMRMTARPTENPMYGARCIDCHAPYHGEGDC